jgi:hypothetical protein
MKALKVSSHVQFCSITNGSENAVFCDFVLIHLQDTLAILDRKTKLQKRRVNQPFPITTFSGT